ncbi:CoA-binding protein, partial [Chloroflexota bacterium]
VFQDVVFRVAPLSSWQARAMAGEIRSKNIIEPFRGQSGVDMEALSQSLVALSEIGLQYQEVQAIDINPLKIRPDGKPVAVDALITLNPTQSVPRQETSHKIKDLTRLFAPDSVAIIGASSTPGKAGYEVIRNILANDYAGKLYLVNPKGGEILGIPVHQSIDSLPQGIDQAIILIPARATIEALRQCVDRGVKTFVLSAGGFSEVDREGEELQKNLIRTVAEADIQVLGPNTSGHTSTPHNYTSSFFPLGKVPRGNISYIAQTGNFATHTMRYIITGENFGVARVIGLGNKVDIDEYDALEYCAGDPETKAIFLYLESFKRPGRFLELASEVTRIKPVFLLKGGSTREGSQAAVAHTAALASDERIVDGALKQAGVTRIEKYSHLFLVAKALACMPLPRGNRVSFLAPSGAMLVILTDLCLKRWGMEVPDLEEATRQRLQDISPPYIRMRNPVDIWASALVHGIEYSHREALEAVMNDANIDAVVAVLMMADEYEIHSLDFLVELAKGYPEKPLYVAFSGMKQRMETAKAYLEPRGVPTFLLIEEPFEVLSMLNQCRRAMERPR